MLLNGRLKRLFTKLLIIGSPLTTLVIRAAIVVNNCNVNLTTDGSSDCNSLSDTITVNSYCIKGTSIFVIKDDGNVGCKVDITASTVNTVKLDGKDSAVITLGSTKIVNTENDILSKLVMIACDGSTCKQISGIVKDSDSKYYKIFKTDTNNVEENPTGTTSCSAGGGLATIEGTVKLCLSNSAHVAYPASGTTRHLMVNANGNVFTGATTDSTKSVVVTATSNYFAFDPFQTATGYYVAKTDGNTLVSAASDTGTLYNCTGDSLLECDAVDDPIGYYINGDSTTSSTIPYIKCIKKTDSTYECTALSDPSDNACTDKIGQIIKYGKLCLDSSNSIGFLDTTTNYIVAYDAESAFASEYAAEKYVVVKVTQNSMTIDTSITKTNTGLCANVNMTYTELNESTACETQADTGGKTLFGLCTNGVCEKLCNAGYTSGDFNCAGNTYYLVESKTTNIPVSAASSNGFLFYCTTSSGSTTCTEKTVKGYYVNSADKAFTCNGTSGGCQVATIDTECTNEKIGKLFIDTNEAAICLNYANSAAISKKISEAGNYLLAHSSEAESVFGVTSSHSGLITISADKSIIPSPSLTAGYYIATANALLTTATTGDLYECTGTDILNCEAKTSVIGYFKNGDTSSTIPYIKCIKNTTDPSNPTYECTAFDDPTGTTCTEDKIGQIIEGGKLCIVASQSVNFSNTDDSTNYIISYHNDNAFASEFSSEKYVVVKVTTNSITIDTNVATTNAGLCADVNMTYTELNESTACETQADTGGKTLFGLCTNGVCEKLCNAGYTSGDFNCAGNTYYLVESKTTNIPVSAASSNGFLFYCTTSSGSTTCTEKTVKGYYVNSADKAFTCNGTSGGCQVATIDTECTNEKIGKLFIDTNEAAICLNYANSAAISKKISEAGNYILTHSDTATTVFGFTSDKSGLITIGTDNSIIPSPSLSAGYYIASASDNTLLASAGSGVLYDCTTDILSCEAKTSEIGYFKNGDTTSSTIPYIKCIKKTTDPTFECTALENPSDESCSDDMIGQIIKDGELCLDNTQKIGFPTDSSSTTTNYIVAYHANSVFASEYAAEKYVVVKVTTNSMTIDTTVVTNDYGLCANVDMTYTALASESATCATTTTSENESKTLFGLCTAGVCEKLCNASSTNGDFNCQDKTYYLVTENNIPVQGSNTGSLYYCTTDATTGTTCAAIDTKGYYVNSVTEAYACTGSELTCKIETVEEACNESNIGKLFKDGSDPAICLNFNSESPGTAYSQKIDTAGQCLVSYSTTAATLFNTEENKLSLITIAQKSVTLASTVSGSLLEAQDSPNKLAAADNAAGTLYSCTNGICTAITTENDINIGYYRNVGSTATTVPYIKCSLATGGTKFCVAVKATAGTDDCSTAGIGGILVSSTGDPVVTTYRLCLDSESSSAKTVVLYSTDSGVTTANGQSYFISINTENVFGHLENGYVIVNVGTDGVVSLTAKADGDRYRYSNANQKLLDFSVDVDKTASCTNDNLNDGIKEFSQEIPDDNDITNYYKEVSST